MEINYYTINSFADIKKGMRKESLCIGLKTVILFLMSLLLIVAFTVIYPIISKETIVNPIPFILIWTLVLFFGTYIFVNALLLPLYLKLIERKIVKKKLSLVKNDEFMINELRYQLFNKRFSINYLDIKQIVLFSDVIMITKRGKVLIYYNRHSFTNATEEEWLAFMKERNPKIKVKYLKNDYIRF